MSEAAAAPAPTAPTTAAPAAPVAKDTPAATPDPKAAPPPAAAEEPLHEVTIKGKKEKWPLSKVLARAQMSEAADRKYFEAEKRAKDLEAREAKFKDPSKFWEAARESGHDPLKLAYAQLRDALAAEHDENGTPLSPEQKRIRELEARVQAREAEDEAAKQTEKQAQAEEEKQFHLNALAEKFGKALEKLHIPPGPETAWAITRMAYLEDKNEKLGLDLPAEALAELVEEDLRRDTSTVFGKLDGDALLDRMGEEWVRKTLKAATARFHAKQQGAKAAPAAQPSGDRDEKGRFQPKKEEPFDVYEWRKRIADRLK